MVDNQNSNQNKSKKDYSSKTQEIVQQVNALIAEGKKELQKEVNELKISAEKYPEQNEFLNSVQQLINKNFNASKQERQEMAEKFKQAQKEIEEENKIKIEQINNMMMANYDKSYDKSIDEELKQLQGEIKREEQSEKGNGIAQQKQMLADLNGATMSADALTPRNSQEIGRQ